MHDGLSLVYLAGRLMAVWMGAYRRYPADRIQHDTPPIFEFCLYVGYERCAGGNGNGKPQPQAPTDYST